jgi:ADP-heptose:LPS heptosyltransferase
MPKLVMKKEFAKPMRLRNFHEKRNKVLILREVGGLGDILMHRMMMEDFHRIMPEVEIVWAVPHDYFQAAENHPFVHEVVSAKTVNPQEYVISYNTTTACGRYENKLAPLSDKHRSDIWANHCGVILTRHNMHLDISQEMKEATQKKITSVKGDNEGPNVCFCPISALAGKNLTPQMIRGIARYLKDKGCFVYGLHNFPISDLGEVGVHTFWNTSIKQWMAIIDGSDYVISVDTSAFHCAGGLGKPLTGIFTFIDGKVYGKYFDFVLVQKHRDDGWDCGPCYNWSACPKSKGMLKPCLTELTMDAIIHGIEQMFRKWPFEEIRQRTRLKSDNPS